MSALAEAALQQGHEVTGSDRLLDSGQATQVLEALREQTKRGEFGAAARRNG